LGRCTGHPRRLVAGDRLPLWRRPWSAAGPSRDTRPSVRVSRLSAEHDALCATTRSHPDNSNRPASGNKKSPACGAFPVRPRGLEPPRTNQSTRPSTKYAPCRYPEQRLDRANRGVCWTHWTRWKRSMLSRLLSRLLSRQRRGLGRRSWCRMLARSAASEPLAEEGVEHEWSILVVASGVALVGEQAFERVLQCAASDSVFVCDPAAGWRLAVGER